MTRPTGEDEMSDMTDERAAEVLAAHNAWRRYNGETGVPGAPEMGDPAELGRAIDHAVSRLRSQPPAEAQAQGGGEVVEPMTGDLLPCPFCGKSNQDRWPCEWLDGTGANVIRCAWCHGAAPMNVWNRRTAPPSAPVGVEGAPIRYFAYDSDCGDYNEFDTLPEAIADAQEALDYAGDDGWPEGGPSIYYGAVLGEAREVEGSRRPAGPGDHPDADFIVEYELTGSDALSHQPAAVDGDWRKKAAEWLEAKAVEQEAANQKWPKHAACYREWLNRPGILRHLAIQVLAAQQGGES